MTWQGVLRNIAEAEGSIIVEPAMAPEGVMLGTATTPKICHPKGKDRGRRISIGHFDKMPNARLFADRSRNGRLVTRCTDADGVLQTYHVFGRKSVKFNRLPRGSKRRTGVWNGQNVADMVSR
jgi:hypothetical protein